MKQSGHANGKLALCCAGMGEEGRGGGERERKMNFNSLYSLYSPPPSPSPPYIFRAAADFAAFPIATLSFTSARFLHIVCKRKWMKRVARYVGACTISACYIYCGGFFEENSNCGDDERGTSVTRCVRPVRCYLASRDLYVIIAKGVFISIDFSLGGNVSTHNSRAQLKIQISRPFSRSECFSLKSIFFAICTA